MIKKDLREGLKPFLPDNSIDQVMDWIDGRPVQMRITRGRKSKLGDYRPPVKDSVHRISVNGDLNPYEFLITLAHEVAHLTTWERYGRRAKPHGKAWKSEYAQLLGDLTGKNIFPPEIEKIIYHQVSNPRANSKGNTDLVRALQEHNPSQEGVFLEELPRGALFSLPNGKKFRKEEKLRKWYRCISLDNHRPYRISPVARVVRIEN